MLSFVPGYTNAILSTNSNFFKYFNKYKLSN